MSGDAPPTYRTESSEWVFAAAHCSILPDVRYVHMSENTCICPSLGQHGHMHRTYTRGRVGNTFFQPFLLLELGVRSVGPFCDNYIKLKMLYVKWDPFGAPFVKCQSQAKVSFYGFFLLFLRSFAFKEK